MTSGTNDTLDKLLACDRDALGYERELLNMPPELLSPLIARATQAAMALTDPSERVMRVRRLADLAAQVQDDRSVEALIMMLDDSDPRARVEAGEALLDVAYDRYKVVAKAIERRAKEKLTGHAMLELPWIIAEVGEPSATKVITPFLKSPDANVIAAAIEALASLGDPTVKKHIEAFLGDGRYVDVSDDEDGGQVTLSELAHEALNNIA